MSVVINGEPAEAYMNANGIKQIDLHITDDDMFIENVEYSATKSVFLANESGSYGYTMAMIPPVTELQTSRGGIRASFWAKDTQKYVLIYADHKQLYESAREYVGSPLAASSEPHKAKAFMMEEYLDYRDRFTKE